MLLQTTFVVSGVCILFVSGDLFGVMKVHAPFAMKIKIMNILFFATVISVMFQWK